MPPRADASNPYALAQSAFFRCVLLAAAPRLRRGGSAAFSCRPRPGARTHLLPDRPGLERPSNLRSDVAIVYGIDAGLPQRIQTWRDRGYRIHVMTGVSWGNYQDYLYGRFDGVNHEDEAQTERNGNKISHGGDVYYMCPGTNFGKFLCVGVQRALDAGRGGDPPRGTGVLGARRLLGRLQARVAELLRRGLAAAAQFGGCPMARLEAEILPLPPRACSRCSITCRPTTSAPAARCAATCPPTACSTTRTGASSARNPASPGSTAATATSRRSGPAPRARRTVYRGEAAASAPSRPPSSNTAPCRTSSAPPAARSGI